jgi:hypothetical protein
LFGRGRKPTPEWHQRYRVLYGVAPPPWRLGNDAETVVAWCREHVARHGTKPTLAAIMEVFDLPKTSAHRRRNCC